MLLSLVSPLILGREGKWLLVCLVVLLFLSHELVLTTLSFLRDLLEHALGAGGGQVLLRVGILLDRDVVGDAIGAFLADW